MADKENEKKNSEAEKEKKKKKGGGGLLLLLLLIILILLGLGIGFNIGGLGGFLPGGTGLTPAAEPAQQQTETTKEEPTPTVEAETPDKGAVEEEATAHVIVVGESGVTFDGKELTVDELTEAVGKLEEGTELVLKDDHAVVESYGAIKAILDAAKIDYIEEK